MYPPVSRFDDVTKINLTDLAFWSQPFGDRDAAFAALRRAPGPMHFREPAMPGYPHGSGYYALVHHADIAEVSRRPQDFCSAPTGISIVDLPQEFNNFFGSMINMDNPQHARLRRIVSRAFGRGMAAEFEAASRKAARQIVDDLIATGPCDFVRQAAAIMPIAVLSGMMGIPPSDYEFIYDRSNIIVGTFDPEYVPRLDQATPALLRTSRELGDYIARLAADRMKNPTDDLITRLVHAEIDGERLTPEELSSFFILLVIAGMETTRNALSRGLVLLTEHPEQRELLLSDFDAYAPRAVEEILRMATPINWMRRTAARECEVGGHTFAKGDKVLLFYCSANRDEKVFADPYTFDITRDPNPHLTFGSVGPHFCLGAHLARMEVTVFFRELFGRLPHIRSEGEPRRLVASFVEAIKHVRCVF
ncbi:cytochrome P450 [Streptomyces sp. 71268]|uniref:cytochrome P450 n=1 Tax=Streptomyces sp. 71268 TaxID=3002640 RepID=UPI0023F8CE08|nr:cytochrome P450 [Streptomyces sp. 71268]WEV23880.1 cytochrome P450 [Streptomyces sp. 71268]